MHRLLAVWAGLWLLVLPRHRLAQALAADAEGFWSAGFWLGLLGNVKSAVFLFGPPAAIYVLGWSLISPTVWVVRGFGRTGAGGRL